MSKEAKIAEALARLRQEYVDGSEDKIDEIDSIIGMLTKDEGDWDENFLELQRRIHTIKGSAGSYGFSTVSHIAHRLEDYMETAEVVGARELAGIQVFVDRIREIFETGANPDDDQAAALVKSLPTASQVAVADQKVHDVGAVFVMPKSVQRKIIAQELTSLGFRLSLAEGGLQALELALSGRPDMIISSMELVDIPGSELAWVFAAIGSTANCRFILMTSLDVNDPRVANLPSGAALVRKGVHFFEDLTNCLGEWGVLSRVGTAPGMEARE